jgi:hypothetical protein
VPPSVATNQYAGTLFDAAAAGGGATVTTGTTNAPSRQITPVRAVPVARRVPLDRRTIERLVEEGR